MSVPTKHTLQAIGAPEGARTGIQQRNTQILIPAKNLKLKGVPFEIRAKHRIEDGDDSWEIIDVEKIAPGPTTILYICTLGR